jgi:hypothetical protein
MMRPEWQGATIESIGRMEYSRFGSRPLSIGLLGAGLCLFVPWSPLLLTEYYEYAMHLAAVHGWQFGTEVLATYGPLGFIGLPFFEPGTYPILIVANVLLYAASVVFLRGFWRSVVGATAPPALWIVAVILLPALGPSRYWAPSLFLPFVFVNVLVLQRAFSDRRASALAQLPLVVVLAAFVLVKGTFIVLILVAIGLVALDDAIALRRFPWIVIAGPTAVIAWWVVARQNIAHLPSYFTTSVDLIAGYKDGMGLSIPRSDAFAVLFAAAIVCVWATACWVAAMRVGRRAVGPATVLAATLFVLFQYAFVRADDGHIVAACLTLASLCTLMLPLLWRESTASVWGRTWLRAIAAAPAAILVLCWALGLGRPVVRPLREGPRGLWTLMTRGTAVLQRDQVLVLERLREQNRLPALKEPIDGSAIDFGLAAANKWRSTIRPSVTTPLANTPDLTRHNRTYIEDAAGPATILFGPDVSIDGRYPTVTDSLSLLALKSHFEPVGKTDKFLILQRRAQPLTRRLVKLAEHEVLVTDTVPVPDVGDDTLWVHIDITSTPAGGLLGLVYKPAPSFITVDVGARLVPFRLTTATAREGMILSPLLGDLQSYESFYSGSRSSRRESVSSFVLRSGNSCAWCYHERAHVAFFRALFGR